MFIPEKSVIFALRHGLCLSCQEKAFTPRLTQPVRLRAFDSSGCLAPDHLFRQNGFGTPRSLSQRAFFMRRPTKFYPKTEGSVDLAAARVDCRVNPDRCQVTWSKGNSSAPNSGVAVTQKDASPNR